MEVSTCSSLGDTVRAEWGWRVQNSPSLCTCMMQ